MPNPTSATARPLHARPDALAAVALGGVSGSTLRYLVSLALPHAPQQWPAATLIVNLVGAFCLGLLLSWLVELGPDAGRRRLLRLCLGTGLLGSFTTYSTLALDVVHLLESGEAGLAGGYAAASVLLGLLAAALGALLGARAARLPRAGEPP